MGARSGAILAIVSIAAACLAPRPAAAQERTAGEGLPALTSVAAIRQLAPEQAARRLTVRLRAIVTLVNPNRSWAVVHDGVSGIFLLNTSELLRKTPLHQGDLVDIRAVTGSGDFAPVLSAEGFSVLGRAPLPAPVRLPFYELETGRYDSQWVEVRGIVRATRVTNEGLGLDLAVPGGTVQVDIFESGPQDRARLLDALVRLRGVCGARFTDQRQLAGIRVWASRMADVAVEEAPPADPFGLPRRALRQVGQFSLLERSFHRLHVRGVVTLVAPGRYLYIQDESGGMRVDTAQVPAPAIGAEIDVVGFTTLTPGTKPHLSSGAFRAAGTGRLPEPKALEPGAPPSLNNDSNLMRLDCQLLGQVSSPDERILILKQGALVFNAVLSTVATQAALDAITDGSDVRLAGVYAYSPGPPASFRLLLRSADDVAVLRQAAWWGLRHTLVLLVVLLVVALTGGLWARTLAAKRRALEEAHTDLRQAHDELEQRVKTRTADLEREVSERRRAEEESRSAADRLARALDDLRAQQQAVERENEERRRAEASAARERDLLNTLMDSIPDLIYFKDRESRFVRVNAAYAKAFGAASPAVLVGKSDKDLLPAELAASTFDAEQALMRLGQPLLGMLDHEPRSDRWYLASKAPLLDAAGQVVGLVGVSKDVTERRGIEDQLTQDLSALLGVVSAVAEGDLTRRASESDDTIGRIARAINGMLERFSHLLAEVQEAALSVSSAAAQIVAAATEISRGAEHGSHEVHTTSAAVEQMATSMTHVSRHAGRSAETAERVLEHVRAGDSAVDATVACMARIDSAVVTTAERARVLEQRSREIFAIIGLIEELAAQSNLLALNAAIEASHAGDAGRGFGVVAGEIRRLAERSTEATRNVTAIVEGIVEETRTVLSSMSAGLEEVKAGRDLSTRAQGSLDEIETLARQSAELSAEISTAARQQAQTTQHVAGAMQTIANVTTQSAAGANEAARAVQDLVALSERLNQAIARFRIK